MAIFFYIGSNITFIFYFHNLMNFNKYVRLNMTIIINKSCDQFVCFKINYALEI